MVAGSTQHAAYLATLALLAQAQRQQLARILAELIPLEMVVVRKELEASRRRAGHLWYHLREMVPTDVYDSVANEFEASRRMERVAAGREMPGCSAPELRDAIRSALYRIPQLADHPDFEAMVEILVEAVGRRREAIA
jgi:predicted transposase YdaD